MCLFEETGGESAGEVRWPWWRPPEPEPTPRRGPAPGSNRADCWLENERMTRQLLAREVYRVPEGWLDEVVRVRLVDLDE